MADVASDAYPQKAEGGGSAGASAKDVRGPDFFKWGENVRFHRVQKLVSGYGRGAMLHLICSTRPFVNRTVWTHETSMHQLREDKEAPDGALHIEITFWSPHVFRVRFSERVLDQAPPAFPPEGRRMLVGRPDPHVEVRYGKDDTGCVAITDAIRLHVERDPFRLWASDRDGRVFWQQRRMDVFVSDLFDLATAHHEGRSACFESFVLGPDEEIYGLGERFDHVPRTGQAVDFWNKDAIGTSSRRTYINVPFFLSTAGYGCFVNSSCRTEWEIGTLEAFTAGFAVEDDAMDYFVILGPAPADVLRRYAGLTGFAPVPPVWSFGLWMSRNSYVSWDVVHEVADTLRERRIPADVLHLDTAWFREDWNCDLRFAPDRFAEPEKHMARLREQGFRVSLWQYNFVPPRENNANYREGRAKGYFAKGPDGDVYRLPPEASGSWVDDAVIDFSNPDAEAWYTEQIAELIRTGAATVKTDFGEGIPEDAIYANIEGRRFHNLYSLVYNAALFEAVRSVTGESIVWARSGTAGSQRYPVHWGGDSQCSFAGLAGTLRGALSLGLSGFPFFSHDIGGFIGRPTPELYVRWAQFGLFSSHSRCHGCGDDNPREPWSFGEEANAIFKQYADLRYRLLPYLIDQARKCAAAAKPMVRALVIDYPHDRNVWRLQDQCLFGDAFLVAPVLRPLSETTVRAVYLPEGTWADYWTRQPVVSRGEWIERPVDLATMPLYVKAGSILPYGEERLCTHNRVGPVVELEGYGGADGRLEYDDGEKTFTADLRAGALTVTGLSPEPTLRVCG